MASFIVDVRVKGDDAVENAPVEGKDNNVRKTHEMKFIISFLYDHNRRWDDETRRVFAQVLC